jgi:hypothetical protein
VLIDEAYVDFGTESAVGLVHKYPNVLVSHTLSKGRGLAGLRVGYAIGQAPLVEALMRVKDSFNSYPLDRLALAGATASFADRDWFEQTPVGKARGRFMLSFSYRVLGEKKVHRHSLYEFPEYQKLKRSFTTAISNMERARGQKFTDEEKSALGQMYLPKVLHAKLTQLLVNVLDKADVVVAHNGSRFDVRMTNAFALEHGITPPSPCKVVDTLQVARSKFRLNSNRLDAIGELTDIGRKVDVGGFGTWLGCLRFDVKKWKKMLFYGDGDIVLLEKVYLKLRPWMTNHPNVNVLSGAPDACPKCGSTHIQSRGTGFTTTRQHSRYQCRACHGWFQSLSTEKSGVTTK